MPTSNEHASTVDHAALVARCAHGDVHALKALFDAEAARMLAVAERIVRRRDLAEEALQESFLQIWSNAGRYDPALGSARSWLFAIVRYRALSIVRDDRRTETTEPAALEALADQWHAQETSVLDRLSNTSRLRRCVELMDETLRRVVLMAYVGGFTHGEIAGRLNAPLGTAKTWVRRGLAELRACMQ